MIFEILSKITLDIIRYLSTFVKSRPLQDFDIIRYLYRLLTGFVGTLNLSYWLSACYKIVHREIEIDKYPKQYTYLYLSHTIDSYQVRTYQGFWFCFMNEGYVRMLYPDSPHHPRQKYLLTVKGLAAYKRIKG